jgi:hypothetical protein
MRPLRPGQDIVLSSNEGAVDCRVVAAAGRYILLQPAKPGDLHLQYFQGTSWLTYLDGMIPMGWDGTVETGSRPGELRFCVAESNRAADRRSTVRLPIFAQIVARAATGDPIHGHVLDVSAGGLRFRHPGFLESGTPLRIRAELPGGMVIDAETVARTVEKGVTSIEFLQMYGATQAEIGEWTVNVLRSHLASE